MSATSTLLDAGKIPFKTSGSDTSQVGAELVILDAEGRVLRGLNPTGARIWQLIDGRRSLAQIAACVATEFEITADRALEDVAPFVAQLARKNLLRLDGLIPDSAGGRP